MSQPFHVEVMLQQKNMIETVPIEKKVLEIEPPAGSPRFWTKSETAGNCFVARSRVELLTDRVERSLRLFDAYCG